MSFVCEISGESLSAIATSTNRDDAIVVTPSGHVCRRSLLLTKLTENGGMDPFEDGRPLKEDELVELQQLSKSGTSSSSVVVVPRLPSSNSSVPHTLQQLQRDYDAVILELFDTRKLLSDTRKELSLALYENDAAVRVVARLAAERDQALAAVHTLESASASTLNAAASQTAPVLVHGDNDGPPAKKSKVDNTATTIDSAGGASSDGTVKLPTEDRDVMIAAWEKLHVSRKAWQKAAAKRAVSLEQLQSCQPTALPVPSNKASNSNVVGKAASSALALFADEAATGSAASILVQASRSLPHLLVYEENSERVNGGWSLARTVDNLSGDVDGKAVDVRGSSIAVGLVNGDVDIVRLNDKDMAADVSKISMESLLVDVRLHPDGVHVVAATSNGIIVVGRVDTSQIVARFCRANETAGSSSSSYTTGVLHPDGLIYVAADGATGDLFLWDFKNQALAASTLSTRKDGHDGHGPVTSVDCSNTGYHIAAAYQSGVVLIWDLRKQQVIATLNSADETDTRLTSVVSVMFDDSGKYLAYSGSSGKDAGLSVCVVTIKDKSKAIVLQMADPTLVASAGLVWGQSCIAASTTHAKDGTAQVVVFNLP